MTWKEGNTEAPSVQFGVSSDTLASPPAVDCSPGSHLFLLGPYSLDDGFVLGGAALRESCLATMGSSPWERERFAPGECQTVWSRKGEGTSQAQDHGLW